MRVLLFALAATCRVASLTAQQRAISDSDLFAFRWVASPQISPDGRQAAYVLVTVNAKHDGYETSLWLVNTDGASPPRGLTAGPRDGAPRWSPDGSTLAFVRPTDGRPQLYLLPLSGGEAQQLTDLPKGASPAAWSPDGKTIAFRGWVNPRAVRSYNQSDLFVSRDGRARNLTADYDFDMGTDVIGDQAPPRGGGGSSPAIWTADGKSLLVTTTEHGRSNLVRFDAQSGAREPVTTGDHAVLAYTATPDGRRFVLTMGDPTHLADAYTLDAQTKRLTQLTHVNDSLLATRQLVTPEDFWYPSFDGKKIETWIMKPVGFTPGKKYPLILNIHGGPHTAYGYIFFHEMQLMAARGYVVVYPNPRGSTTYGQEFGNIIQYKYPGDDYKDLMVAVDSVIRRGYVDSTKLGVTGGSGGGLLTDWTVGHTHRFAAAASQRDVADWLSFWYTADFTLFQPSWFRSTPFRDPEEFLARSPVRYADSVTTPLMFILGDADLRTPPTQGGEAMFRALKYLHRTTVQVRFPGESHELSRSGKPVHRVERLQHILNWFDKYLQGKASSLYDVR